MFNKNKEITLINSEDRSWQVKGILQDESALNVGRADDMDLKIDFNNSVSRRHCRVFMKDGEIYVMDLDSSYNTYVDDQPVNGPVLLRDGSILTLGSCRLEVHIGEMKERIKKGGKEMAFFDEIGKSISGAGQSAVRQAKDVAEITRISAVINENRSRIADINRQLGEKYFSLHTEDPEEELAELINEEKKIISENEELQEQLMQLRGQQKCPSCGTFLSKDALFCAACGSKIVPKGMKECPQCGKMMKEDSAFCTQCGFAFN